MAELIFIAAMMILILIISFAAVYFFFKTYRKEMANKDKASSAAEGDIAESPKSEEESTNGAS